MRAAPNPPAPQSFRSQWREQAYVVLITRLFGGGARTREVDKISWLRSSAAKSAIRAWWRAGQARAPLSLDELKKREEMLFGSAATFDRQGVRHGGPGALQVIVQTRNDPWTVQTYQLDARDPLNTAYFPASLDQPPARLAEASDRTFARVLVTSRSGNDEIQGELLEGLRLWLTLGGVGGRTRRGAGALAARDRDEAQRLGLPTTRESLEAFLAQHCQRKEPHGSLAGVFSLARTRKILLGRAQTTGEAAQSVLLSELREARKGWPEANAVRLKSNPERIGIDEADRGRFPKAALGLPIQMVFKSARDPEAHHIFAATPAAEEGEWNKLERYASPILLRPVRIWQNGEPLYVPVALFTDCILPAAARPLVTPSPNAPAADQDIVHDFEILKEAELVLQRVQESFEKNSGFSAL